MEVIETYEDWNLLVSMLKEKECYVAKSWAEYRNGNRKKWNKRGRIGVVFFEEKATRVEITYKNVGDFDRAQTKVFFLDGEPRYEETVISAAAREFKLQYKYKEFEKRDIERIGSASPVLGYNEKWSNTRQRAWEYDLKSAYSWALLQDIPNTDENLGPGIIEENMIGFSHYIREKGMSENSYVLKMGKVGDKAMWRFPAMKSPYENYVKKYYRIKENAKDKKEKNKAKAYLNVVIGNL